jgi:lipopolysaccharide export system permease protein
MKTLDRYLALSFLKNFGQATVALVFLYVFQAFLGELGDHEFTTQQLVFHHLMSAPSILVQMTPPAVLIATVLTLSNLNRSNELVACYSIGIGLNRIMSLVLSLVFMISCFSLVLQDRILPPLFKKRTTHYWREMKKRQDFFLDVKQDKIWYRSKNLIYNLKTFDQRSKTIRGMSVYTFDPEFNLLQLIDAESATYTPSGWKLSNGSLTVFSKKDPITQTERFEEKSLMIPETPTDFQEIEKEVDGLRIRELHRYITRTKDAGTDTKGYEVKLHARISMSFIPLVMCLLAIPFSTGNRREGGMARDLGLCFAVTFFYWLFYSVGLSLGTNGALPPWLAAWLPSAVFAILTGALISRQRR